MSAAATTFDEIRDDLSFLEDWEDRYRYVIDLGRRMPPFPEAERTDANKVRGCASQVWLSTRVEPDRRLVFEADSDAHIVKGLVALIVALYSGRTASEIMALDARAVFDELGLAQHLTAQRSNGVASMVARIRADAGRALASA